MTSGAALALAVAGAVGYGVASVLQAAGARRAAGLLGTLRAPAYLAGVCLDLLAWLLSVVALRILPVYQVQAVLAGSLAVTVVAARLFLGTRLRTADVAAVAVTVVALAALAAAAGPQDPAVPPAATRLGLALAAVPVALAGWALAARGAAPNLVGAVAGLAYGGAALCARAVTPPGSAVASLLAEPLVWALAAFGLTGTLLYAHALEHGQVGPVTALLWIVEVLAPSAAGVLLLGDDVRPGWEAVAVAAVTATVAAAAVLAFSGSVRA
jgi:drug/metabolite transporter (DMT)-like permease